MSDEIHDDVDGDLRIAGIAMTVDGSTAQAIPPTGDIELISNQTGVSSVLQDNTIETRLDHCSPRSVSNHSIINILHGGPQLSYNRDAVMLEHSKVQMLETVVSEKRIHTILASLKTRVLRSNAYAYCHKT